MADDETRKAAEQAFGGDEKPGLLARFLGRGTTGGLPSNPSGASTPARATPPPPPRATPTAAPTRPATVIQPAPPAHPTAPSTPAPRGATPRTIRRPSTGSPTNVAPIVRAAVIIGVLLYGATSIFSAVHKVSHARVPTFPGITTPAFPSDPTGTGTSGTVGTTGTPLNLFTSDDFALALRQAKGRVGTQARMVAIRLDPGKAVFVLRDGGAQKVVNIEGNSISVFTTGAASTIDGILLSQINPDAPRRIVARLKSRFGVAPSDVEYLAAIGTPALRGSEWSAHTTHGDTYTADATGRVVKPPPK